MTQILHAADALFSRLRTVYTDELELSHSATTHATNSKFLTGIADVFCIVVHETDGSAARARARRWYDDYRNAGGTGGGPQLVIWADGTVMSLVELPYRTSHGNVQNNRAIGVETGHNNDGRYGDNDAAPDVSDGGHTVRNGWHELSTSAEDINGAAEGKFFSFLASARTPSPKPAGYPTFPSEVVTAQWSTKDYLTPAREPPGPSHTGMYATLIRKGGHAPPQPTLMLFTEWQYRSWALLARYLCEALLVPRNFPVLPHARSDHDNASIFKKLVLADEHCDMIIRGLNGRYYGTQLNFAAGDFTGTSATDLANLQSHYTAARARAGSFTFGGYPNSELNLAWLRFFDFYRGIHGHGFSGNQIAGQDDHDCPGPMFDWHRFAREVWDWWWLPFDFDAAHTRTDVPDREYRRADGATPLAEYFFYDQPSFYHNRSTAPGGIQGASSSPATFALEEHSPVYALANGELIAARYPLAGDTSMAFVLVRHEVFHVLDQGGIRRQNGLVNAGTPDAKNGGPADIGRIDYSVEPTMVYSLYMHLGRHANMNFSQVDDHNPDWLNRVLIRMTECDLALPPTTPGVLHPTLNGWAGSLTAPPPLRGGRPTPLEAWRMDQERYRSFLNDLAAGEIAIAPQRHFLETGRPTPIRVILGDYLGVAGVIRKQANVSTHGLRVEVFSPSLVSPAFSAITDRNSWNPPAGVAHPALLYESEWARALNATEQTALKALGIDPTQVQWWPKVALHQMWDLMTPMEGKLPLNGRVYHYSPLDFMAWINDATWTSEWSKYRVTDGANPPAAVARPVAPRPRRF